MRVSKDFIYDLKPNEVFVFGANTKGIHGAGAAKLAQQRFGATYGKYGHMGQSYGIPTKDDNIQTLPLNEIEEHTNNFISFAEKNPDLTFLVTEIGCGLASLEPKDIAPFFRKATLLENVYLPKRFLYHL